MTGPNATGSDWTTVVKMPHMRVADRLGPSEPGQRVCPSQKRGSATGPNPTDRGKPGTKRHLVTDARGTPLGFRLTGANRHDSVMMAATLDAIPPLRTSRRGRPRRRPGKLHADKAYDHRRCRQALTESSQRRGRHRWVVERTHAWFNRFRRLSIRYERRDDIYEAFTGLAACLITLNQIRRFC